MNKITIRDKQLESKTFCVLPWNHLHVVPDGRVKPCCNNKDRGFDNPGTVESLMNSEYMKEVRLRMLAGEEVTGCDVCYNQERATNYSPRIEFNNAYSDYIEEDVKNNTKINGGLEKINLRYIDVRQSNVCNFKCRYCSPTFSSKWAQENAKHGDHNGNKEEIIPVKHQDSFISDLELYLNKVERVYFAGGEPLITEGHYALLETLTKLEDKPNIFYSTNLSILDYKDYNITDIWKKFPLVYVTASIDHIGKRAEYMRHGTVWSEVEQNLKKLHSLPDSCFLNIHILVSNYNFLMLTDILRYIDENLPNASVQLNNCVSPEELCVLCMPQELLDEGVAKLKEYIQNNPTEEEHRSLELNKILMFTSQESTWELNKNEFWASNKHLDRIRKESFTETFPELKEMWYE